MSITKAQRALRNEDNRRVWKMRMDEIKILINHLKMLAPISNITAQEQLNEANARLDNAEDAYNAQIRD